MRAFMVLLALVATPLAMGVSQTLPGKSTCANGQGSTLRSAQGTANAHKGLCVPQDPPSPPPVVLDTDGDGVPDNLDSCPGTAPGTTVDAIEQCSAFDGTWGMKSEFYDLSRKCAGKLCKAIERSGANRTCSDCLLAGINVTEEMGNTPVHPIEIVRDAYGLKPA